MITEMSIGDRGIMSILNITSTRPSLAGQYTCTASNGVSGRDDINEISVDLRVHGMYRSLLNHFTYNQFLPLCASAVSPMVTSVMDYTVNLTETATFECAATGIPAPSITWFRNGVELNDTDPRITFNPASQPVMLPDGDGEMVYMVTRSLTLGMAEDEDSATYECLASNAANPGQDRNSFELVVQSESLSRLFSFTN